MMALCLTGKAAYLSKLDAELAVLRILRRSQKVAVRPARTYCCKACGLYHLTSQTRSGAPKVT